METNDLKLETVATTTFASQAELIRSILESGGFEVFIANKNAPTYVGLVESVQVQVPATEAEAARRFLEDNLKNKPSED